MSESTSTARDLAAAIHASRDYRMLPILADAIETEYAQGDFRDLAVPSVTADLRDSTRDPVDVQPLLCRILGGEHAESLDWLMHYQDNYFTDPYDDDERSADVFTSFEDFLQQIDKAIRTKQDIHLGFVPADEVYDDAFWGHYERVMGISVSSDIKGPPDDPFGAPFRCSC